MRGRRRNRAGNAREHARAGAPMAPAGRAARRDGADRHQLRLLHRRGFRLRPPAQLHGGGRSGHHRGAYAARGRARPDPLRQRDVRRATGSRARAATPSPLLARRRPSRRSVRDPGTSVGRGRPGDARGPPPRHPLLALRDPRETWPRGHGRCLSGARHQTRTSRRAQGPACRRRLGSGQKATFPPGGQGRLGHEPFERLRNLRSSGSRRRPSLHRHGVHRRSDPRCAGR